MLQEFKGAIILCSIVSLCASQKPSSQRFEREPEDQTAVYGESVVLACRVINKSGQVQWTKDDFGLGTDRELSEFERYSMIGTDDEGTYALRIQPVTLEDEGKYQCQVGPGPDPENEGPIRSRYATLTVYVPPDPPQIVQSSHLVTTEDREVELECQSRGGKPASEVNWLDSDGNLITEGVEVFKDLLQDNLRTNVKSVLKLIPKQEFHNKTFTCQAQNAAERSPRVATIRLEVKYAPKVTVKVINSVITELDTVKLSCSAEGNPSKMDYKWYVNNEVAYGDYSTELTINSVTRKLHNAVVKCEVQNRVGTSEDTQTLNVHYSPRIIEKPVNVEAEIGSNVTLRCIVDSNPPAEIVWTHESSSRVSPPLS
ncbi:hypothetical protein QYM36_014876 [Artemia franciscana]|uniref:Ig-like domain-containing protein n=1 Tax=Artemia franciscana TaxID=6661 RepID=A0AA88HDM7_ARTSF|nr:hypothetical protein QYM36_014876 [Artemia franciscana]